MSGSRLRLSQLSVADSGEYVCRADVGSTSREATVTVTVTSHDSSSYRECGRGAREGTGVGRDVGDLNGSPVPLSPQACRAPSSPSTRTAWLWPRVRMPPSSAASTMVPGPSMSPGGWGPANTSKVQWSLGWPQRGDTTVAPVLTPPPCPDNVKISTNGSVISITGAHAGNQGAYHCVASNRFGVASSVVNLLVQGARWPGCPHLCPCVLPMLQVLLGCWWCPYPYLYSVVPGVVVVSPPPC